MYIYIYRSFVFFIFFIVDYEILVFNLTPCLTGLFCILFILFYVISTCDANTFWALNDYIYLLTYLLTYLLILM